ncbi:MAG: hypothetical protein OQK77_12755, partial [Psychromonas sp.]|nr:hypothetical protein [Psychromonas sp.]
MDKVITLSSKQLSLSTDKQKLLLSIIQVQQPINESDIIDLIKTSEYKDLKINTNALKEAVVKYNDIKNGVLDN